MLAERRLAFLPGPACRLLSAAIAFVALAACEQSGEGEAPDAAFAVPEPEYVGGQACAACHTEQLTQWQQSHHDLAMQDVDDTTVLGDFDDAEFVYGDVTTRFFRRDGGYWVSTDGPDGSLQEFEVVWTFGVDPLQQYLLALDGGRIQALSAAWDARPAEAGGQRWFHLYPDELIDSEDPLHWTGVYQGWNSMCADCHSTELIKSFDTASNSYQTSFASIDVDCEACHGPGSVHAANPSEPPPALSREDRNWVFEPGATIATRIPAAVSVSEPEVCAQCHSRRAQLRDGHRPGDPLYDSYRPALLEPGLYHADGQIQDEVYVYGSFLQSRMAAAGVTCSDCHEPHSAELRAEGNGLCAQCHLASTYDQPEHHQHEPATAAAECTSCHMRTETYMVVDPRRDHSFRVPRPDLSVAVGSPNACIDCHQDQSNEWAASRVAEWYPDGRHNEDHFGFALHAGRSWAADARDLLVSLIEDREQPEIARATAVGLLAAQVSPAELPLIERTLDQEQTMLQLAAIDLAGSLPPEVRVDLLQRFLTDERFALRIAAARHLLSARNLLSERRQSDLAAAIGEYLEVQDFNGDRPEGMLNIASVAVEQGSYADAESVYRSAIGRHPAFAALYINLSDLYRLAGRAEASEQVLREGIEANPDDPGLGFALGLALVRSGQPGQALPLFVEAAERVPEEPYYRYVLAIARNDNGERGLAVEILRSVIADFPGYADAVFALATMLRDQGDIEEALDLAGQVVVLRPGDEGGLALLRELEQQL